MTLPRVIYEPSLYSEDAFCYGGKVRRYRIEGHSPTNTTAKKNTKQNPRNKPLAIVLQHKVDLALIGTFPMVDWEKQINRSLDSGVSHYWLPWGNRTHSLRQLMKQLIAQKLWERDERYPYFNLCKPVQPEYTLYFFHYRSKNQAKLAHRKSQCIATRYEIDRVLFSHRYIAPKQPLKHDLLRESSNCWWRISGKQLMGGLNTMDVSDFNLVLLGEGQKRMFKIRDDGWRLYKDVPIVQHFSHKATNCRCPQCRD